MVDNRVGANGIIGTELGAKSLPDGYTLVATTNRMLLMNKAAFAKLPFEPLRDFDFITIFMSSPFVLCMHPSLPAKGVRDLVALAGPSRLKVMPDLPTLPEQGVEGADTEGWYGLAAPRGTPPEILRRVREVIGATLNIREIRDSIESTGSQIIFNSDSAFRISLARLRSIPC